MKLPHGTNRDHLRYPGLAVLRQRHPQPGHQSLQEQGGAGGLVLVQPLILAVEGSPAYEGVEGGEVDIYLVLSGLLFGFLSL